MEATSLTPQGLDDELLDMVNRGSESFHGRSKVEYYNHVVTLLAAADTWTPRKIIDLVQVAQRRTVNGTPVDVD
jgi:hypothetical protein